MKRKILTRLLAISLSVGMVLQPVTIYAETPDSGVESDGDAIPNKEQPITHSEIMDDIQDAANYGSSADNYAEASGDEMKDVSDTLKNTNEKLTEAKQDVSNSKSALDDEMKDVTNIGMDIDLFDKDLSAANGAISDANEITSDAINKNNSINVNSTTEEEAEQAIGDIKDDIEISEGKLQEAEKALGKAQADYEKAKTNFEQMTKDASASEKALSDAKQKLVEAEENLENSKQAVLDYSKKTANESESVSAYKEIREINDKLSKLTPGTEEYNKEGEKLAKLVIQYYVLSNADAGCEVVFGEDEDTYVTGYIKNDNGEYTEDKVTIQYKTVTYMLDGKEVTKKIKYSFNNSGMLTVSERKIDATESEVLLEGSTQGVLTNKNGEEFNETDTSHVIYIDENNENKGFYAIDTETSEVINHVVKKEVEGTEYNRNLTKEYMYNGQPFEKQYDSEGNSVTFEIHQYHILGDGYEQTNYFLMDGGIAEVKSKMYSLDGIRRTFHQYYVDANLTEEWKTNYEKKIRSQYENDKNLSIAYINLFNSGMGRVLVMYSVVEKNVSIATRLQVEKTVYAAEEYKDHENTKVVYNVSENEETLMTSHDNIYLRALTEKEQAISTVNIAKDRASDLQREYEKALESVKKVKTKVETLEKAGAPANILNSQKRELEEAETALSNAKKAKEDADKALAQAKNALTSAEAKLDAIINPMIIIPSAPSSEISQDREETSYETVTADSFAYNSIPAGAVTISLPKAGTTAEIAAAGPAVLGAERIATRTASFKLAMLSDMQYKETVINNINATPAGGMFRIETDRISCFDKAILEAFAKKSNIDMEVLFPLGNRKIKVTIPAGYDISKLLDNKGYCGFLRLLAFLGGEEVAQ